MKITNNRELELSYIGDLADCIEEGRPNWIPPEIWESLIHDH